MHIVDQSLSSEVEQNDEYIVMKSLNSDKEYEVISSNINNELSENQKTSSSAIVNEFYSKI